MKKKSIIMGSLALFSAAPLLAGGAFLTESERLEAAVRADQSAVANAGIGTKMRYMEIERQRAKEALARDQAALEAFKTMGPTNWEIRRHEQGIRDAEAALRAANSAGKLVYIRQQQDEARRSLAYHQAALDALKGK